MSNKPADQTDRERILMYLLTRLNATILHGRRFAPGDVRIFDESQAPRFDVGEPKPGDLVMAMSSPLGVHEFSVGWYVEKLPSGAMIRSIGSDRLCRYENELFMPLVGVDKSELLESAEYRFRQKVLKAFTRGGNDGYRFGGLDINGSEATIKIRHKWTQQIFSVSMSWNTRTPIKAILEAMIVGGYGTTKPLKVTG